MSENQRGEVLLTDYAHSLTSGGGKPGQGYPAALVAFTAKDYGADATIDCSPTLLRAGSHDKSHMNGGVMPAVAGPALAVRRLLPVECNRLMGWPDDHTAMVSDSQAYKQAGNGVASPVTEWIGRRLMATISEQVAA